MIWLCRLALLAGTLDGCVQLLSVRGDEAARTHKSKEWYWLDAAVSAEYCSTYRDALADDADDSRAKQTIENTLNATTNPTPTNSHIPDASSSSNYISTVRQPAYPCLFCTGTFFHTQAVGARGSVVHSVRFGSSSEWKQQSLSPSLHTRTACVTFRGATVARAS
jgi:hypothetical protein